MASEASPSSAPRVAGSILGLALALATSTTAPCAGADADGLEIKTYGNTEFTYTKNRVERPRDVRSSFSAGQLELFPTYSADRVSFLAEVVFEGEAASNEVAVDLERVQITYLLDERLRLKAGRMHTAFGYYNDAYHHGRIFELTTGRPWLVQFEDAGGLLPAHLVGVGFDGKMSLGEVGDLRYDLEIGNGRDVTFGRVSVARSTKERKQVNARLRLLPAFLEGLVVGVNVAFDEVAAGSDAAVAERTALAHALRELAAGAHVVYMERGFHLLAEGALIRHEEVGSGATFHHAAAFVELGYALDMITPYARYEAIRFSAAGDPLYALGPLASTTTMHDLKVGTKWLATENVALKLEWRYGLTNAASALPSYTQIGAQCAFGF